MFFALQKMADTIITITLKSVGLINLQWFSRYRISSIFCMSSAGTAESLAKGPWWFLE